MHEEKAMNIVYAAEKPSIADLLSDYVDQPITEDEINISENPDETGSFRIDWRFHNFVLSPNGEIASDEFELSHS